MKRYVTESVERNSDGEELIKIEVLESKPKILSYIVWISK